MNHSRTKRGAIAAWGLLAVAGSLWPAGAQAQHGIYRCRTPSGTVELSDRACTGSTLSAPPAPPPKAELPVVVEQLENPYAPGSPAAADAADAAATAAARAARAAAREARRRR